ncbi:MAG: cysteine-rich small domain-containing protein [Thermoguttaceae bacterium]|jgi:Zn-finger protein
MDNSHRFFKNVDCRYYPCHKKIDEINCLFCYCPLYGLPDCPGTPEFVERNGKTLKKCTNCVFPHVPEHYDRVIAALKLAYENGAHNDETEES